MKESFLKVGLAATVLAKIIGTTRRIDSAMKIGDANALKENLRDLSDQLHTGTRLPVIGPMCSFVNVMMHNYAEQRLTSLPGRDAHPCHSDSGGEIFSTSSPNGVYKAAELH